MKKYIIPNVFLLFISCFFACDPSIDEQIALPERPEDPTFSLEILDDGSNRVVIKDLSQGFFSRVWDLPGGTPNTSTLAVDTILYQKAGDYFVTLHGAKDSGGGTASSSQPISFEEDAILSCTDELVNLTGGCENPNGKCWTFSQIAGAISVGPTPGSTEWFTSPEGGLVPEQYDDRFCFTFEASSFQYKNNGSTIDPFNGYAAIELEPPTDLTYFLSAGGGENGETRIVLPEGAFMGVMDSGPLYDIIFLTETELVVRSQITGGAGWFDLYFISQ